MIQFTIPGTPVAKARPRVTKSGHAYTPKRTASYTRHVMICARQAMSGRDFIEGPLVVTIDMYFPVPKSMPKQRRQICETLGRVPHTVKPDVDNLAKAILDAMNGVVYADDAAVWSLTVNKHYGFDPKAVVLVQAKG